MSPDGGMSKEAYAALEAIRKAFHEAVENLDPSDYRRVMEEFEADLEGRTGALNDEEYEAEEET